MNITDTFVNYLYEVANKALPNHVIDQARLCAIDYVGCAAAGARLMQENVRQFIAAVTRQCGTSTIIGTDQVTTLHNAALINAMNAHATELDDGHRMGMIHLGASIFSALLPLAELEDISQEDVLKGAVLGYEAAVRTAMSMQPSHKIRGYHTSGTCGTIGTAIAVATAFHFTRNEMKSALSAATGGAAGLLELQENDSELKPYNLAHASVAGITAAYVARAGYAGPEDPIGGRRGLLSVLSKDACTDPLTCFEDGHFEIEQIYRKPYAACRHCHPAIEAALAIKHEYSLKVLEIDKIEVETYKLAVEGHDHIIIPGTASAKLSLPFSVALALVKDHVGLEDYSDEVINDPSILDLCQRVSVKISDMLTSWSPKKRAAIIHITTIDGRQFSSEVDYPKGEPENPMTRSDILEKYHELTSGCLINKFYKQYEL